MGYHHPAANLVSVVAEPVSEEERAEVADLAVAAERGPPALDAAAADTPEEHTDSVGPAAADILVASDSPAVAAADAVEAAVAAELVAVLAALAGRQVAVFLRERQPDGSLQALLPRQASAWTQSDLRRGPVAEPDVQHRLANRAATRPRHPPPLLLLLFYGGKTLRDLPGRFSQTGIRKEFPQRQRDDSPVSWPAVGSTTYRYRSSGWD